MYSVETFGFFYKDLQTIGLQKPLIVRKLVMKQVEIPD